jgi:hypothetical protein
MMTVEQVIQYLSELPPQKMTNVISIIHGAIYRDVLITVRCRSCGLEAGTMDMESHLASNTYECPKGHLVDEPSPQSGRSWCRVCEEYIIAEKIQWQ